MKKSLLAALAGVLFAVGLGLGGMLDTRKVLGFLDVTGDFDPRLMLVMGGAILVFAPVHRIARARALTRGMEKLYELPRLPVRDPRLVVGAVLFGVGWGLVGYCPGPALVSLGGAAVGVGTQPTVVFVLAMAAGMALHGAFLRWRGLRAPDTEVVGVDA